MQCLFDRGQRRSQDCSQAALSFSVVICTNDRRDHLARALHALRYQTYANYEVCVVAGPSEDGTIELLRSYGDDLKIARCSVRNLSRSRNIGIALAGGDVVAFIDDDAIPEPEWLEQIARSYDDERVGAAGGVVHDHDGIEFQARFVTVDRLGRPNGETRPKPELNFPGASQFPHLLGTNCSFRRSALIEIGGFDENYEYFLDETDVCCRINDGGFRIVQRPDAFVHHKYAPSALRDAQRTVRSWYPLIKNRLYFGLRHARAFRSPDAILESALEEKTFWQKDVMAHARSGQLGAEDVRRFHREAEKAVEDGLKSALEKPKLLDPDLLATHDSRFRAFPRTLPGGDARTVIYLDLDPQHPEHSKLRERASEAAREGHRVHLITRTAATPHVDFELGVWVHDLGDAEAHDTDGNAKLLATLDRIASRRTIDAVYSAPDAANRLQSIQPFLAGLNSLSS